MASLSAVGDVAVGASAEIISSADCGYEKLRTRGESYLWINCAYLNAAKNFTVERHQKGSFRRGEDVLGASLLFRYIHIHIQDFSMCKCVVDIHL